MSTQSFRRLPMSRRRLLKTSALAAGALALPFRRARAAGPLKPVSMTLDWVFQGANVGYMMAQMKGFYAEAGLDVAINSGKGSAATAQLVAAKATQIGFADGFVVGNGVSKGMKIKTIGSVFRRNPSCIMVFADSPINTPKDLEGKSIAITATSAVYQQWPAFAKGAGIDASNIQIINIDPAGIGPALISGKVDAIGGYVGSYQPQLEVRGKKKVRLFWFSDAGVTVVSNGIITHRDTLDSDPDLLRAFVPPSIKGFLYAQKNPDEAAVAVKKYLETADDGISKGELEAASKTWVTPNTKGKPLGWGSEADWASTIGVLKQYGGVTAALEPSQLFNNDFVPSGAEYVPPQEA
jgi:NitT/TauT family transport system substrate-binding protein